jgi:hypothetical protein
MYHYLQYRLCLGVAGGAIVYQNRRFENVSGKVKRRRQKQAAAGAV